MFLDPKYDAKHDKQLRNAQKGFIMPKMTLKVAENGFLCYITVIVIVGGVDFGSSWRGQDMTMEH